MKKILTTTVLFSIINFVIYAEEVGMVEGWVMNEDIPIPGVTIKTSETDKTTTTNKRGFFKIRNAELGSDTLLIDIKQEIFKVPLDGNNRIDICLKNDTMSVSRERKIIKQPKYGGTLVTGDELRATSETNLLRAIALKVPGVRYVNDNLIIRGPTSINLRNTPLYVIDGAEVFSASHISIYEVESVEILKGSESAIFGVRGAAGVVIINLKK